MSRTRRLSTRRLAIVGSALALGSAASVGALSAADHEAARAVPQSGASVTVTVADHPSGRPIPAGFLGLSLEYSAVPGYAGADPADPNPLFPGLVRMLTPGARVTLRIGGNSADRTWIPAPGVGRPRQVWDTLDNRWFTIARGLGQQADAQFIFDLNLAADDPKLSAAEAEALLANVGRSRIQAFEIGNEPELYAPLGHVRPQGYNFTDYQRESAAVARALPSMPLAGPATGSPGWFERFPALLESEPALKEVTFHRYPLVACIHDPASPKYPTLARLLRESSSRGVIAGYQPAIAQAHSRGLMVRVDELNSVACTGKRGISDRFASALWAIDTLFTLARDGIDGVNFHMFPHSAYGFFDFKDTANGWSAEVHPEFYGALLFEQAAPAGARLLPVALHGGGSATRAWATLAPDGQRHVVLINDSLHHAQNVSVLLPDEEGRCTVTRLLAPGATSAEGVSLAGQTFGTTSTSGRLRGARQSQTIEATDGACRVTMPAASAATITF